MLFRRARSCASSSSGVRPPFDSSRRSWWRSCKPLQHSSRSPLAEEAGIRLSILGAIHTLVILANQRRRAGDPAVRHRTRAQVLAHGHSRVGITQQLGRLALGMPTGTLIRVDGDQAKLATQCNEGRGVVHARVLLQAARSEKSASAASHRVLTDEELAASKHHASVFNATRHHLHRSGHTVCQRPISQPDAIRRTLQEDGLRAGTRTSGLELDGRPRTTHQLHDETIAALMREQQADGLMHVTAVKAVLIAANLLVNANMQVLSSTEHVKPPGEITWTRSSRPSANGEAHSGHW